MQEIFWVQKSDHIGADNNILFVLDVSQSMNVQDIWWESRLESAKAYIRNIIQNEAWYEFALSIFAGESQRVLPFTQNVDLFATILGWLDSQNILEQGTNIEAWLTESIKSFGDDRSGYIVILTDGDDREINISGELRKSLESANIRVKVIWFWTSEGWPIPTGDIFSPYKIYQGQRVIVGLNEDELRRLAKSVDGEYASYDSIVPSFELGSSNKKLIWNSWVLIIFASICWFIFLGLVLSESYIFSRKK